jgi:Glycosyltransferase family 10 (fucosyltransferase) C-term
MNPLIYVIKKRIHKRRETKLQDELNILETENKIKYEKYHFLANRVKVCTYQTGFNRHFTRYFNSTINDDFTYSLVENPNDAEVIVFINTIDESIIKKGQQVILFFHEPKDYSHLYRSTISENLKSSSKITVVSHLSNPSEFIVNSEFVNFYRSIPFVHFHHGATREQLLTINHSEREGLICSVTSGFKGIPGYDLRRRFIIQVSERIPELHLYGRFSKESAALPPYVGPARLKWETLRNYKYNLVIENSGDEYYISEKIFDALICGCMPIYSGSEKIFDIIPNDWFYYLPSLEPSHLDSIEKFVRTDAYKTIANNRENICKKIYEKYSFYTALDKVLNNQLLPVGV